jgi:enoyl-CoA hydratase/carnithine racemase
LSGKVGHRIDGAVATVTLNHPARFNAMSRTMWRQLRSVFEQLQADTSLRCVVLQGEGAHFCAGGDISEYPDFRFDEAALRDFHEHDVWGGLSAVLACDLPVLAQISGNCMGAGVEIASCCDIRLAAASARFGAPIARLGFPMAPREAQLVAGAVGVMTAREMLLGAAVLEAREMRQRGFLNAVLPDEALAAEVASRAQTFSALGPQAARLNKQTLRALSGSSPQLPPGLLENAYRYADSAEHREGIAAFMDKRTPRF